MYSFNFFFLMDFDGYFLRLKNMFLFQYLSESDSQWNLIDDALIYFKTDFRARQSLVSNGSLAQLATSLLYVFGL